MFIRIDKTEVITYYYEHPRGLVYYNPTTGEEFTQRKISIEGHLSTNMFPFWVTVDIAYPKPPPIYPDCREVYHTVVITAPISASFRSIIDIFDDRAYYRGAVHKTYFLVPMEGLYMITLQASWLPLGIKVAASEPVILDIDTRDREDRREALWKGNPPSNLFWTEA